MKKLIVILALAVMMLSFYHPAASTAASSSQKAVVNTASLSVREKPSPKAKAIGTLKRGQAVSIFSIKPGGWAEISFNKKSAYVPAALLKVNNEPDSDNSSQRHFAEKQGAVFVVIDSSSTKTPGIYKTDSKLKKTSIMRAGNYSNIRIQNDAIYVFNENLSKLQKYSLKGSLLYTYSAVNTSQYTISGNTIYYFTEKGFFRVNVNGKETKFLYKPAGWVQEFIVHNGWIYFVYVVYEGNSDEEDADFEVSEFFSKIETSGGKSERLLLTGINNIDTITIKYNTIYCVIHWDDKINGRNLYQMNLSGKEIKKVSSVNLSNFYIGSLYIYYNENSFASKQSIYQMTFDGKNHKKMTTLPGRMNGDFEYQNGAFYMTYWNGVDIRDQQQLFRLSIQ
ncbi:hypothetical protein AC623_07995 [Bacillus sp. FJAT-27231]|uniref:DUF5050 domain-containing protein n=1 Tax=Bacillus sp. FJAT-27231 TaxID=1679168 RepID=UPI0006709B3F|nr:DUF5050 domain-containing protein [Bacillus sp. FJAT-27231]KMY53912.1 hypothetical protein AC623_07995 [Bacillus sp. FJAT-27231]